MQCSICQKDEADLGVDARSPNNRAWLVVRGQRPICSLHMDFIPPAVFEATAPKDPYKGTHDGDDPNRPLLQTFTEEQMRNLTHLYDDLKRLGKRLRQTYH